MQLDGPILKYYSTPPSPDVPTRPRGTVQLVYYPGEETAMITDVMPVAMGR